MLECRRVRPHPSPRRRIRPHLGKVTLTAVVTSQTSGAPSGNFTFKDESAELGTVARSGSANLTTSKLGRSSHAINTTYTGSKLYLASSVATTQPVNTAATTTTLSSLLNPSTFGQTVTFTASVSSKVAGTISGSITFSDTTTSLGTVTSSAGKATFSTSKLNAGAHSISAHYKGSRNFAVSTSKAVSEKVNQVKTTTLKFGTAGVAFSTHQAKITKSNLTVGSHNITAVYGGSSNFVTSKSPPLSK